MKMFCACGCGKFPEKAKGRRYQKKTYNKTCQKRLSSQIKNHTFVMSAPLQVYMSGKSGFE